MPPPSPLRSPLVSPATLCGPAGPGCDAAVDDGGQFPSSGRTVPRDEAQARSAVVSPNNTSMSFAACRTSSSSFLIFRSELSGFFCCDGHRSSGLSLNRTSCLLCGKGPLHQLRRPRIAWIRYRLCEGTLAKRTSFVQVRLQHAGSTWSEDHLGNHDPHCLQTTAPLIWTVDVMICRFTKKHVNFLVLTAVGLDACQRQTDQGSTDLDSRPVSS